MAQQRNRGQESTDDRRHHRRRGGHFEVSYKTNERTRMKLNLYCCVCRSTRINFSSNESAHIKTTDSAATQLQLQLQLQLQSRRARERAVATATAAAVPAIDRAGGERRTESGAADASVFRVAGKMSAHFSFTHSPTLSIVFYYDASAFRSQIRARTGWSSSSSCLTSSWVLTSFLFLSFFVTQL